MSILHGFEKMVKRLRYVHITQRNCFDFQKKNARVYYWYVCMTAFAFGLVFFRFSRFLPYFFRFHEYFSPILSQFNAHRVDFFHLVIVSYNVHRIHIMALQVVLRILDFPPLYIYFFLLLSIYSSCSV